jgi:hypothetical protein
MTKLNLFIPITKVDAAKRLVYGTATAEIPDRTNEVCDYASTKPLYEKWSADATKATDGKSKGNLRVMHNSVAAGKLTDIVFDDANKRIEICAKVVDDAEWKKVEEGVYTGFSQGGSYVKRWKDETDPTLTRYTADPVEVSLVDLPCLPDCSFEMIKADGSKEMRKFVTVEAPVVETPAEPVAVEITNAQVLDKATELAKEAGSNDWAAFIAPARDALVKAAAPAAVEAESAEPAASAVEEVKPTNFDPDVVQVWKATDGTTHSKKADALKASETHKLKEAVKVASAPALGVLAEITAALDKREGKPAAVPAEGAEVVAVVPLDETSATITKDARILSIRALAKAEKEARAEAMDKGLYDVARLASLIVELGWLQDSVEFEAEIEGDGSAVPSNLKVQVAGLCDVLVAMVSEETSELVGEDIEVFEMAAGKVPHGHFAALVKLADKLGKAKEAVEKAGARHSKADVARLNAAHDLLVDAGAACDAKKAAEPADLAKVTGEKDALQKALDGLTPMLSELLERVKVIEAQPAQGTPTVFKVVGKEDDVDSPAAKAIAAMKPEELATLAFKLAQQNGQPLTQRGR